MSDDELLRKLESLRNMMVSVATGGPRINDVNPKYQQEYSEADHELRQSKDSQSYPLCGSVEVVWSME